MDKHKKIAAVIIVVFMILNIWTTLSLKEQVKNLQNEMGRMNSYLRNEVRSTNSSINNMKKDLLKKIEQGESLLSAFETDVEYRDEQLAVTINIVPKEKRSSERVFLSLGNEKKEMTSFNGSVFVQTFELTMPQEIIPTVSFEASTGVKQEVLPEINITEFLSLGYQSDWGTVDSSSEKKKGMFTLTVFARDQKSSSLLNGKPIATLVIKDIVTDSVIGRKDMQLVESNPPYNKELGAISFRGDLSKYHNMEGSYQVWLELKTKGGIFYREQIASFENADKSGFSMSSGGGTLYPVW